MTEMYPALFQKEGSYYNVKFPDIPEAITCGDSLEQAMEMAEECLSLCLIIRKEMNEEMPKVSEPCAIHCADNEVIKMIKVNFNHLVVR